MAKPVEQEVKDFVVTSINQALSERFGDFSIRAGSEELAALKILPELIIEVRTLPEVKASVKSLEENLGNLRTKLDEIVPSIKGEVDKMNAGQATLQSTLTQLDTRNAEITAAINKSFTQIDEQVAKVKVQSDAAAMMQQTIHDISAKQLHDIHSVRSDVERFVISSMERVRSEVTGGDGGGRPERGEGRGLKLNDPKKSEVDALTDNMSPGAFALWRANLDLHLEEFGEFGPGVDVVLRGVRMYPGTITPEYIKGLADKARMDGQAAGNYLLLKHFDVGTASRELYKFLHKKLTVAHKAGAVTTCPQGAGFDLYRYLCRKMDVLTESSKHVMLAEIRQCAFRKAKDLNQTRAMIISYVNKCNEYVEKTDLPVDEPDRIFTIWMFMDEASKAKAERRGLVEGVTGFADTAQYIEDLINKEASEKTLADYAKKVKDPSAMDLSAVAPQEPAVPGEEDGGWKEESGGSLDAFGGQCHKCGGKGHRQAECTSQEGNTIICHGCGGQGHYMSQCPSGKGKGGKDPKGKGKGGKGAWDKGGKGKGWDKGSGAIKGKGKGKGKGGGKGGKGGFHEFADQSGWDFWGQSGDWWNQGAPQGAGGFLSEWSVSGWWFIHMAIWGGVFRSTTCLDKCSV